MSHTVVITRPPEEEHALANLLHRRGYHVINEPLSHIFLKHTAQFDVTRAFEANPDAIIVTSRHGAQALATLAGIRDVPVLCVGKTTEKALLSAGFDRVTCAGGTVDQLLGYVMSSYDNESRFLYLSADHVRKDISTLLSGQGMPTERIVAYQAVMAEQFSDTFAEHLKRHQIGAVTFLSQRAAHAFTELAAKAKLVDTLHHVRACSMSKAIAEPLTPKHWKHIYHAQRPTLISLANCIDQAFERRKKA